MSIYRLSNLKGSRGSQRKCIPCDQIYHVGSYCELCGEVLVPDRSVLSGDEDVDVEKPLYEYARIPDVSTMITRSNVSSDVPYCELCEKSWSSKHKFCEDCGAKVQAPSLPVSPVMNISSTVLQDVEDDIVDSGSCSVSSSNESLSQNGIVDKYKRSAVSQSPHVGRYKKVSIDKQSNSDEKTITKSQSAQSVPWKSRETADDKTTLTESKSSVSTDAVEVIQQNSDPTRRRNKLTRGSNYEETSGVQPNLTDNYVTKNELLALKTALVDKLEQQEFIILEMRKNEEVLVTQLNEQLETIDDQEELISFQQKRIDNMEDQISLILDMLEDLS